MRIRAFTAIGLAAAALLTVSACRVEQGAAVFIGPDRISEKRVDEIIDSIPAKTRDQLAAIREASGGQMPSITTGTLRGYVVDALVVTELGKKVAADTGRKPVAAAADTVEAYWTHPVIGLDADSRFVEVAAKAETYRELLFADAAEAEPSDADVKAINDQLSKLDGQPRGDAEDAALKECLGSKPDKEICGENAEQLQGPLHIGRLNQVRDYVEEYQVSVNPRYGDSFIVIHRDPGMGLPVIIAGLPN